MDTVSCPICGSTEFKAFNSRPNAACMGCGSLERGRLTWLLLKSLDLLQPEADIMLIAPELFMMVYLDRIVGSRLFACDVAPDQYKPRIRRQVERVDLCCDLPDFDAGKFDIVIHNHVLEHVPCSVVDVLKGLNRLVKPGGYHLFSTPIIPTRRTEEDLDPALSKDERVRRFHQDDHMRIFGWDFMEILNEADMNGGLLDTAALVGTDALRSHAIPEDATSALSGNRVFVWRQEGIPGTAAAPMVA